MKIKISAKEDLSAFFQLVAPELGLSLTETGKPLELICRKGSLKIIANAEKTTIYYQEKAHLFRGLLLWTQSDSTVVHEEFPQFDQIGPMIDLSRNAVLSVPQLKRFILLTSKMGLNSLMLYMEDTYEIPEYPYFGHLRGRYSQSDLRELDQYADQLGVTLVPAIQTLAHLTNPLKWSFAKEIRDTEDILLVGEPQTYAFLEAALRSIRSCFKTNKIHIGMDEAHQLGKGRYLERNGLQDRFSIMLNHLNQVIALCDALQLEPMMWSDMFFRIGSPTGDYYDPEVVIPPEVIQQIPAVTMVYWDYYHHDAQTYQRLFAEHKKLNQPTVFAGGIWTWNGLAPNYGKTLATMEQALKSAKSSGVTEVYGTLWGDDGAETPMIASLLGLQLFSEAQFYTNPTWDKIADHLKLFHGLQAEEFLLLDLFDQTPGVAPENPSGSNPSKLLLYQDILYGLYEKAFREVPLTQHYEKLAQRLAAVETTPDTASMFRFYHQLAVVLSLKAPLSHWISDAYQEKNREKLQQVIEMLQRYQLELQHLHHSHRNLWFEWNRPFGFEVIDLRYGALAKRAEMAQWRLQNYLAGHITSLPELEVPLLPVDDPRIEGSLGRNLFHGIYSASKLSDV
ncbi:beta-N-acetylhexosaminidase [Enterococcus sp.]|uniref:beta-N-acetylhexosaminidase n=1 Tax=Enterococcus sp. TaxID=35783 RepID=UPI0025B90C0F|nr:beta-N-acetylhexosaminidase [Enterococcus sp.]